MNKKKKHIAILGSTGSIGTQSLEVVDLSAQAVPDDVKLVLPSNYSNINFIAPFKIEDGVLHIAISDSSKLSLMRNLKTITKKEIESNLYTSHLPQSSPDMILRTSGEKRLSGFLMWQSAYSELVFMDIFWPEFRKIDLMRAIRTFQVRKRRLGK